MWSLGIFRSPRSAVWVHPPFPSLNTRKPLSIRLDAAPASEGIKRAISLTDNALKHLHKMILDYREYLCLRISIKQGGSSGMSYMMEFKDRSNTRPNDSVIDDNRFIIGKQVGKTSLINRYVNKKFNCSCGLTVEVDYATRKLQIDDKSVTLEIWDTPGHQSCRSIGTGFYRGADCCVLVYDVNVMKSFESLKTWHRDFLKELDPVEPEIFPFIVLGNKVDVDGSQSQAVTMESAREWCELNGMLHLETSAKEGINLDEAFCCVARKALKFAAVKRDREPATGYYGEELVVRQCEHSSSVQFIQRSGETPRNHLLAAIADACLVILTCFCGDDNQLVGSDSESES